MAKAQPHFRNLYKLKIANQKHRVIHTERGKEGGGREYFQRQQCLIGSCNSLTPRRNFQLGTGVAKWHNIREVSIGRNHRIKQPIIAYLRTNPSGLQARRTKIGLLRGAWSCKLYTTTKRSPRRKITSTQFTQFFHGHTHRIGTLSKVLGRPRERDLLVKSTLDISCRENRAPNMTSSTKCSARTHAQSLLKESSIPQLPSSSLSTHSNPKKNSAMNSSSPEPLQQQQQQQLRQQAACMISSRWGLSCWHFSSLTAGSACTASVTTLDNTKNFYIPIRKVVTSKVFCIFLVVTEGCL